MGPDLTLIKPIDPDVICRCARPGRRGEGLGLAEPLTVRFADPGTGRLTTYLLLRGGGEYLAVDHSRGGAVDASFRSGCLNLYVRGDAPPDHHVLGGAGRSRRPF